MAGGRVGGKVGSKMLRALCASRRGALRGVASCVSSGECSEGVLVLLPCFGGECAWKSWNAPDDAMGATVVN